MLIIATSKSLTNNISVIPQITFGMCIELFLKIHNHNDTVNA